MVQLPTSLLNRMYEPESLRNTDAGFELAFKNRLAPSTLIGVGPLVVDGVTYNGSVVVVRLERPSVGYGRLPEPIVRPASEVSSGKSLRFEVNTVARVVVPGQQLSPGQHELVWSFDTQEVGAITLRVVDQLNE